MKYQDLLPARYKNLNFFVLKESITSGLNKQYTTTPNLIKNRKTINLANLPTEITLDIVLQGSTASYSARKLLTLAESKTSGTLQIPTFGVFKNMVFRDSLSFSTDLKRVGVITSTITFIENLDVDNEKNLLSKLDDLSLKLQELTDKLIDSVYFLSNLTEKLNTTKANINRGFTALNTPLLLVKDLSSALALKTFFKQQQQNLTNLETNLLEVLLLQPKEKLTFSTNTIEQKQQEPINLIITYNKLTELLSYVDNLKQKEFISQQEVVEKINYVYEFSNNVSYETNLTTDIKETLDVYVSIFVDFLFELNEELPELQEVEVLNESSISIAYRTQLDLNSVRLIEKLNNFQDLDNISGKIKCLKLL